MENDKAIITFVFDIISDISIVICVVLITWFVGGDILYAIIGALSTLLIIFRYKLFMEMKKNDGQRKD